MSDKMRWRYGDTNPVLAAVDADTAIEIGDLASGGNGLGVANEGQLAHRAPVARRLSSRTLPSQNPDTRKGVVRDSSLRRIRRPRCLLDPSSRREAFSQREPVARRKGMRRTMPSHRPALPLSP